MAFGLTSGIFSNHADEVTMFLDTAEAGVLYVNRRRDATTGARPASRHSGLEDQRACPAKKGWARTASSNFMHELTHTVMT